MFVVSKNTQKAGELFFSFGWQISLYEGKSNENLQNRTDECSDLTFSVQMLDENLFI